MAEENKTVFSILSALGFSDKIEQKNDLNYLSWAWAWGELKKLYPDSTYTVYENKDGWNYHTDGKTCWVKCGVTVNGLEHIEMLPVMDYRNKSILLSNVTSFDVIKAIQRCVTKAIGRHGLGLYIYAGEDLPEEIKEEQVKEEKNEVEKIIKDLEKMMETSDLTDEQMTCINKAISKKDVKMMKSILYKVNHKKTA